MPWRVAAPLRATEWARGLVCPAQFRAAILYWLVVNAVWFSFLSNVLYATLLPGVYVKLQMIDPAVPLDWWRLVLEQLLLVWLHPVMHRPVARVYAWLSVSDPPEYRNSTDEFMRTMYAIACATHAAETSVVLAVRIVRTIQY